jgi:hypothetical protein
MLVLIETVEGKVVWVNPAYVTDVNEVYLPKEGSNARSVYVTRGLERPAIYHTFEDMFPLVERLNEANK